MQGITADKEAYIEEKMKQFKLVDMRNCYEDIKCQDLMYKKYYIKMYN